MRTEERSRYLEGQNFTGTGKISQASGGGRG